MGLFSNLFGVGKVTVETEPATTPYVPPYPLEKDFYQFDTVEWNGVFAPHSITLSFVLPYSDWCEFEKSDLYRDLEHYLQELQKRDTQRGNVSTQD